MVLIKFGKPLMGQPPPPPPPKKKNFKSLKKKVKNPNFEEIFGKKMYVKQIFGPNFGVFQRGNPLPKMAFPK